jgi:sec-independent protein translocase protein TatA
MPNIGAPELLLIALVILLLFGATRLPKLGRSMGQSISGFKKGLNDHGDNDAELVESPVQRIEVKTDDQVS